MLIDKGHFAEEIAMLEKSENISLSILGLADFNGPGLDDIHSITKVAVSKNDVAFFICDSKKFFPLFHGSMQSFGWLIFYNIIKNSLLGIIRTWLYALARCKLFEILYLFFTMLSAIIGAILRTWTKRESTNLCA